MTFTDFQFAQKQYKKLWEYSAMDSLFFMMGEIIELLHLVIQLVRDPS